jgi:hypothetical protein
MGSFGRRSSRHHNHNQTPYHRAKPNRQEAVASFNPSDSLVCDGISEGAYCLVLMIREGRDVDTFFSDFPACAKRDMTMSLRSCMRCMILKITCRVGCCHCPLFLCKARIIKTLPWCNTLKDPASKSHTVKPAG